MYLGLFFRKLRYSRTFSRVNSSRQTSPGHCGTVTNPTCFAHESTHVRQFEELGLIGFVEKYYGEESAKNTFKCISSGFDFFRCLYKNNALEREAYDAERP